MPEIRLCRPVQVHRLEGEEMSSITHNSVETEATLTALKAEIERLERVSELKSARIAELERELFGDDMSAVNMIDLLQEQLAAAQAREAKLRDIIFVKLEEK